MRSAKKVRALSKIDTYSFQEKESVVGRALSL